MRTRIPGCIFTSLWILLCVSESVAQTSDDLFNEDILHEISIYIAPEDYATLKQTNFICAKQDRRALAGEEISTLPRVECHFPIEFHWMFNGRDITGPEVAVSSHGQGSRSSIKPSFGIQFNRYESRNTFLGLRSLVLRANTQDASLMHERLAMAFFRRLGIPAPRESHARVYINDEYAGVYTIVEDVDPVFLERNFGESDGYLYAYEWVFHWGFGYLGPDPSNYSPLPFKPENNLIYTDPAPIEAMVRTINQTPDEQFSIAVSQYIDLIGLFRLFAAENFVSDQDSFLGDYALNNFFLYRFRNSIRSTFILWDKSNAFWTIDWDIFHNFQFNVLTSRALNAAPDLIGLYKDTLRQAADTAGGPGGWLEQEITKEYRQIRQAVYEDQLKLCDQGATGYLHPCSNEEFEAEVAHLIRFAQQRAAFVRSQLDGQ
jgi:spore coat protein CotH